MTETAPDAIGQRVSTLELFVDLVFVFTVTQLAEMVSHPQGVSDYLQAVLVLGAVWWMYDGYVWLTGNVRLDLAMVRAAIFVAMGGYLLMALAIPGVFGVTQRAAGDTGVAFGIGFLVVTVLHTVLFLTAPNSSAAAIRRLAPFNLVFAVLVLLAAFVDVDWRWTLWAAGLATVLSTSLLGHHRGFAVSSAHFIERHGLVVIVALGESVVAIGVGASGRELDAPLVTTAMLALALNAALWWLYFDHDDSRAEATLAHREGDRASAALRVAYAHLTMVAGIIGAAAGIKLTVAHPTQPAGPAAAWNLGVGVALYVLGEAAFRFSTARRDWAISLGLAAGAVATVAVGLAVSGVAQLATGVAVVVAGIVVRDRPWSPGPASSADRPTPSRGEQAADLAAGDAQADGAHGHQVDDVADVGQPELAEGEVT